MSKLKVDGNLGAQANAECRKAFGKGLGGTMPANPLTKQTKVRVLNSGTNVVGDVSGPNTVGGVVGGMYDQASYQGVKARK